MANTYFLLPGGGVGITPDGTLPPSAVVCTELQYRNAQAYMIDGNTDPPSIVDAPAPTLTPQQQAAADLAVKLAAGITLTSTGTPAVNGVYALDAVSTAQIFQIGLFAAQFDVFPSGNTTQPYPDITGTPKSFTVPLFVAFLRAVAPLVSTLETQAGIEAQGGTPTWPAQTATIA